MKNGTWRIKAVVVLVFVVLLGGGALPAGAVDVLQNGSFENYDAGALVPDNWQVIDGSVQIYSGRLYHGAVSIYSLGGRAAKVGGEWVVTPNSTQGGAIVQLVNLSTMANYDNGNWINMTMSMLTFLWCGARVDMVLEYLPPSYDGLTVTANDAAWNGPDVVTAASTYYTSTRTTWGQCSVNKTIPKMRWARVKLVFDATWSPDSDFTKDGDYYVAVDAVSLSAEVLTGTPCSLNLLSNSDFEFTSGGMPDDWRLLDGRMTAIDDQPLLPAYSGAVYAGNIGGTVTDGVDYPAPPQYGSMVQLVDLSTLPDWSDADAVRFNFSLFYMRNGIQNMRYTVEYLPEDYNEATVAWNDPAWNTDARIAVANDLGNTGAQWRKIEVGPGSLTGVRWMRVRLEVTNGGLSGSNHVGPYLGGFDHVCLQVETLMTGDLIKNASFEQDDEDSQLADWRLDPAHGGYEVMTDQPAPDGQRWLGKSGAGDDHAVRLYQVIDLANKIPFWQVINSSGSAVEYRFIQLALSAWITNHTGASVKVGLEYLPYSYNTTNGITWNHTAWRARQWVSNGSAFTNNGGDAIDLGAVIQDATADAVWRKASFSNWIPRARWLRLRIELDATPNGGGSPLVGIDDLKLSAVCWQYGPYSGFGRLPEANYPGAPGAQDMGIPGWTGPEGDGISGGYENQTLRNYVNPAFAGFADDVASFSPSGQYNYDPHFQDPMSITGRPYNDAGWVYQIITLGDMDLAMLADYFGPAPSGDYHPGQVTASFQQCPIVNGPGPDFATFENGFVLGWTTAEIFGELAYVEVSSNGTDFIRFPTHSLTPYWPGAYGCFIASGVFGMTGKHVNAYGDQWGTPFDLEWLADHPRVLDGTVDLNDIRYVRHVDIPGGGPNDARSQTTALFLDSYGNPIFDSWVTWGSGGADLDAIGVLNTSAVDSDGDHIVDYWDNCSQTSNENQYDADGDGYGNMCDCDIDGEDGGDGSVNMSDYMVFRAAFGGRGPERIPGESGEHDTYTDPSENWNANADFNGDNAVDLQDYQIFKNRYGSVIPFE
jgi:hypothetical protein